jgi:hypothetical protein
MATVCPACGGVIPESDVNVAKDIAFCRKCDKGYPLSELVMGGMGGGAEAPVDLSMPVRGAWYRDDGGEVSIGATLRSVAGAGFMIFFSGFWNAITWTLVIVTLRGFFHVGQQPVVRAGHGTQITGIFPLLFMIPFVLIGAVTGVLALMMLFGRVEVTVRGGEGQVFTGIGGVGRRKRFDAAAVTGVAVRYAGWQQNRQPQYAIYLEGPTPVKFGSMLTPERRAFIAAALRKVLG